MDKRAAGILMPITSLPSEYGIGCFSKSAYDFVDWLKEAGQSYWQILPLGPTSYGDSPYQSFSTFAGNPYFISLKALVEEGVLTKEDCDKVSWGRRADSVDYEKIYKGRYKLLRKAYENSNISENPDYQKFVAENSWWLSDYALFMAVKDQFGGVEWTKWAEDIRLRWANAMDYYRRELYFDIEFQQYMQFKFYEQWMKLKKYANEKGIQIIGDIPIYVAMDSADTWAHPELFQLDEENVPVAVAGCPPDGFSATGQLWGNPLYRWDVQEKTDFAWWKERMKASGRLYDVVRIDHFIGVVQYYAIPAGAEDGRTGEWLKGPGKKLTDAIGQVIGDTKIIAEDLGIFVPEVKVLLEETGYPGMKIIEFAFSGDRFNEHLPHMYTPNSVVYGGTHDNETLVGYFKPEERQWWELQYIADYMGVSHQDQVVDRVMFTAYGSVASVVIFQAQDVLKLDNWARMNTPGTVGSNWRWRMRPGELNQGHADHLAWLVDTFGRF